MTDDRSETPVAAASPPQAQALLEFAVSQSSAIFYIADIAGEAPLRFISSNVEAITGHPPKAFLEEPGYGRRHIHADDLVGYDRAMNALRQGQSLTHEYRFATAGGEYRWFRDEVRFVDPDGKGTEFIGCMIDVTAEITSVQRARENVEMFKSILDASPIPMSMVRLSDRVILYENPAIHAVFREDAQTAPRHSGAYDVDPSERNRYFAALAADGAVDNFEIRFRRHDGTEFVASHSARLVEFEGDKVVVAGIVDLTEQKRRERDLDLARQTLEDAIESLSEGFVLYDADDRLVLCNSQYKAFHGDSADLLVPGALWSDVTRERGRRGLFHEAEAGLDEWLEGQLAQRGKAHREEFPFGDGRWYEYSHRKTRQGGFVSVWHDITDRVAMEQTLRESEEHFRSIVEGHPLPVWMVDLETSRILYESPAAAEMVGREWPSNEPAYTTDHVIDTEMRDRFNAELRRRGSVLGMEVELRRADGSVFWASINDRLISYGGREVSITSFVDLTRQHEADEEMARQRERLHQNEKLSALGELLAGVAHELNNPLSILVGQALLLQETATAGSTGDRAERIAKAADRCARIVKTFLAMARQETGAQEPVSIMEIVENALEVTAYSLRSSGVDVAFSADGDLPLVSGDADRLIQVFTNLIVNAEHAMRANRGPRRLTITSALLPESREVEVTVRDSGPGIPPDIRSRVFEPLYTTKRDGGGTGMGLALCHRIVSGHGGSIYLIDDEDGTGAAFAVRLPCADPEAQRPTAGGARAAEKRALAILVVDDEADVGETIAEVLMLDGHAVTVVQNGKEAMTCVAERAFDVILSDVRMPGLDGPSFHRELHALDPALVARLAFITGDTLSPHVRDFLDSSGRPFIEKPILPQDARDLVARVIGSAPPV